MDTKKAKTVLKKGVMKAKREVKKGAKEVQKKSSGLEASAMKEFSKMKMKMEGVSKKVESYVKKNPEKAMLISAGIAAALAGVAALAASKKGTKKKK